MSSAADLARLGVAAMAAGGWLGAVWSCSSSALVVGPTCDLGPVDTPDDPHRYGVDNPACTRICEGETCSCVSKDERPCMLDAIGGFCRGCDGRWTDMSSPDPPWWVRRPPTECSAGASHCPPEIGDTCVARANWGNFIQLELGSCNPPAGAMYCDNATGKWAQTCASDADCPADTVCALEEGFVGECRKACTTGAGTECLFCDARCVTDAGYCFGTIEPCRADCECPTGNHRCMPDPDYPNLWTCQLWIVAPNSGEDYCRIAPNGASEALCPCVGGTCRETVVARSTASSSTTSTLRAGHDRYISARSRLSARTLRSGLMLRRGAA